MEGLRQRTLEGLLEKVRGSRALSAPCSARSARSSPPDLGIEDARKKVQAPLLEAVKSGLLSSALGRREPSNAVVSNAVVLSIMAAQMAKAEGSGQKEPIEDQIEELRQRAKEGLMAAAGSAHDF